MAKITNYLTARKKYYTGQIGFDWDEYEFEEISHEEISEINVPKSGCIYYLVYVGKTKDSLMFEGGFKDFVRVENRTSELKYFSSLNIGDEIDVLITNVNERTFLIEGSVAKLYESRSRNDAHNAIISSIGNSHIMAHIKERNPAGYNVDLLYNTILIPSFMPTKLSGANRLTAQEKDDLVGQTIEVMVESFSRDEGTFVVSRQKYLESLIPEKIKELKTNTVYKGIVTGTIETGIFVEFMDFLTGMIHVSNVDPAWQNRLSEIPSGFEIEFYVENITSSNKINLTQILRETLWDTIKIGQIVNAKVISIKSQGILCKLGDNNNDNTMGMIHTSEVEKNNKTYNIGNTLMVKTLKINREDRKIFLSIV